jgi:hypothetical protein
MTWIGIELETRFALVGAHQSSVDTSALRRHALECRYTQDIFGEYLTACFFAHNA